MIVTHEKCHVCGHIVDFVIDEEAVLLREAKCEYCNASIRNSDTAGELLNYMHVLDGDLISALRRLTDVRILNACSSGYIHEALKELPNYTCCEYFDGIPSGEYQEGVLCVDLCNIPFPVDTFDIVITEDVFEHIACYEKAMEEILRVLKVGGCHIFTVPLHENKKTESRVGKRPVYHDDPVRPEDGTLVITDWGADIKEIVEKYGYRVQVKNVHSFYGREDVTDVDCNYEEYLKNSKHLEKYLKYNSVVIVAEKVSKTVDMGNINILPKTSEVVALNKAIRDKNDEIRALNDDNEMRGKHIVELDRELQEAGIRITALQAEDEKKNQHIQNLDQHIEELGSRIRDLDRINEQLNRQNSQLNGQYQELNRQNEKLGEKNQELSFRNGELSSQNQELSQRNDGLDSQNRELSQRNDELSSQNRKLNDQNQELAHQNRELTRQNQELKQWNSELSGQNQELNRKHDELENLNRELNDQNQELTRQYGEVNQHVLLQKQQIERQEEQIADLKQAVLNKEGHIELLLEVERKYEHEKTTHAYKFAKRLQRIGNVILPINSRRRFFARIIFNVFRHPRLMVRVINPKRIKNYMKYMRLEGMEGVKKRYEEAVDIERMHADPSSPLDIELEQVNNVSSTEENTANNYDVIELPLYMRPAVSIIIPAYNEFHYTYNCLKAIFKNSGDVAYEVLIADDCSEDVTREVEKIVKNVRLITTEENVRFLRNCNHAAQYARGEYLLFLNNDTQVQDNWLKPLMDLIERDGKIGMVGSKLVYPDGYLQEAGGIVWEDASAWNYGNRKSPEDPEYNYVKEVDYISGAAIMIRKALWEEIGGFDERFAPAYCEDSDLAFEVRRRGYKVLYQPLSVVVHFEGVSNGTDVESGLKSYQVINQQKFRDKWQEVLKEHYPNAEKVFCARDRSTGKKVLLMIDHYVPQFDKDAGSRTVFQYLCMFVNKGYHVKFIGDNFYRHEPYTTILQQMGIEVLYGPYYANHWKEWVQENSEFIDFVFLNRPHIAVHYIDYIREHTKAKIIYYGHDLHFLREMRQYELTKDQQVLEASEDWKQKELALMRKADIVYYPSYVEVQEIARVDAAIRAKAITAYIFENVISEKYCFDKRKDIMFVGGFTHTPNIDAVLWFAKEIFPDILRKLPDITFYIIGSNTPLEVKNLASDNVVVKGFVTDEELEQFYHNCRISVVPLRFGAGIKGKVIEAMRYGIPVLTTSTGAEGIRGAESILSIEDDAQAMAERLVQLYHDEAELRRMSMESVAYIQTHFSEESAWEIIEEDFN